MLFEMQMRLARIVILLLLAAVIAAEPVVHTHPLVPQRATEANALNTPNVCGVCAVGVDSIAVDGGAVVPPRVVVEHLVAAVAASFCSEAPLHTPSRAPPAA